MTNAKLFILGALATHTLRSAKQLRDMTGVGTWRLYPALMALEREGRVASEWENMSYPRRRRYRLVAVPHLTHEGAAGGGAQG